MPRWNLLTGALPLILLLAAAGSGAFLLIRRGVRGWWTVAVPSALAGAAAVTVLLDWLVDSVWRPFPDPLPVTVLVWGAVILSALAVAAVTLVKAGWRRRVVAIAAAVAVTLAGLNQINREYGYYPTLQAAFGQPLPQQVPLPSVDRPGGVGPAGSAAGSSDPSVATWRPAGPVPAGGVVSQVDIPGTVSHFHARPGWVYLPPAYQATPRPDLPVLMLIPGQPGNPDNWIQAGHLITTMDDFAASHHGLAPIVLMPDATGSTTGNPMCLNSALGNADTYLSEDVASWARIHLQVDGDTAHWAVGGFSYGGTCALQLAVGHPDEFPTFLDIAGDLRPSIGPVGLAVVKAFRGDRAAYDSAMPLAVLHADGADPRIAPHLRRMAGTFVVGTRDRARSAELPQVVSSCAAQGIEVRQFTEPGGHSWYVASLALRDALPWLASRMGLT